MSDTTSYNNFLGGLAQLGRFERGSASYEVNDEGDLVHAETVVTVKMHPAESLEDFHRRLRREYGLQKGDRIEILNNSGRCDTARLTLAPR
ncbi:MAG TPA: hypothetical protein PKD53_00480 [Chloroflexaceae bacterium]|nr:hypothetical protein [Chloroflexaceae bacterium]